MAKREISYPKSAWQEDISLKKEAASDGAGAAGLSSGSPTFRSGRLEAVAEDVVIAKADAASEAMILLAALRVGLGPRWSVATIDFGPAKAQKTQATSLEFRQQAAHLLPGNILINGKNTWDVARAMDPSHAGQRLSAQLEMAFGNTWSLPACFNVADSQAEGGTDGLKKAFAEATVRMGYALSQASIGTAAFRQGISEGLKFWFARTSAIYSVAAAKKAQASVADSGEAKERRLLETRVLAAYGRSFKVANPMRYIYANQGLNALLDRYG